MMKTSVRLLRYLVPYRRDLTVLLITMVIAIVMDVLRPWPTKLLVDNLLSQQPLPPTLARLRAVLPAAGTVNGWLLWLCLSTVAIFAVGAWVSMVGTTLAVRIGRHVVYELGADLFLHLQRLSLLFHSRRPVGDMVARVTGDPYCVQTLLNGALLPLIQSLGTLAAMFIVMWRLDSTMTLLALGVTPFLALTIHSSGNAMKARHREWRDLEGHMMSVVQRTLSAIPMVQAFTREDAEYARYRGYAHDTVAAYQRATVADMRFKLCVGLVTATGTAAVMWYGAREALAGRITVGTIIIFLSYVASLYGPLNAMTYTASAVQAAAANADRIVEILDTAPDVWDAKNAQTAALQGHVGYENVTFGYEPGRPVLRGISFDAEPSTATAIVGSTGAGKTTLVNLLVRFFDPWSGTVTIDGQDIRGLRVRSLRQQVAIVLQDPFIFSLTVADNIAYGRPDATRQEIVAAAVAANADEFIRRLPNGYETVVGESGATLSGGEKQRLAIARAFLKDAPILILDEPTSALDLMTESRVLDALDRLMKGRTTFIIAHRLSTIQRADRILVLEQGLLVETGRHDELIGRGGPYARLYRQQLATAKRETSRSAPTPLPS